MRLEIRLLGPFEVHLDGKPLVGFKSAKVRALLAYLAAEAPRTQQRGYLAGLLWPDYPQGSANQSLRHALYNLRKTLQNPDWITADRQTITLVPGENCWVDVRAFGQDSRPQTDNSPAVSRMRSAVELYRGEFLEGFSLSDSPAFEDWQRAKAEYYRRKVLGTLDALVELEIEAGGTMAALRHARRAIEIESWHEPAHRKVIRLLALQGQRAAAVDHYQRLQAGLRKELQIEPSVATKRLVEQVSAGELEATPKTDQHLTKPRESKLPSGTVTFLFTDIVGSTPLWEQKPDLMAQALAIHNTALRSAIQAHGGVVFKTVGDAFQSAFPTALPALQAAISGQRAFKSAAWNELGELKVRMGLHTGEAELDPAVGVQGGDEYAVSHTKNRAARIMSAAHGGQILLSAETKELVDHHLPEGVTLKDLGEHRLKGLGILERLYQVAAPGLAADFPPLVAETKPRHNLPLELTTFIGREKEIEAVCGLLLEHRLVTLTGVGGTGKTRLSLHVAGLVLENYPNGAWLVELAGLTDPAMVPRTAASALNLPEIAGKPVIESLVDFLREKRLLLILDNCEHLLEGCIDLAERLLRACPDLAILTSSREFLGVPGEVPYRLPPMALPDLHRSSESEQLYAYDAVKLFVERARVVVPDFAVTEENAAAVVQVVERLDGIPLAIELAAARMRLLGVEQIAQRLNDAFRLLTGGARTALPRHQALRASIDWSYDLLSEPERILLRRLSVFARSWSLGAAEVVCVDQPGTNQSIYTEDVLDLLNELVDKSLVNTVSMPQDRNRFRMLETIRQYAHQKLDDEGEVEKLRTRHLSYYLSLVEDLEPKIRTKDQVWVLSRLELELDNIRLAMAWGLQTDVEAELKIAAALMWFWIIRTYNEEGIDWLDKGLMDVRVQAQIANTVEGSSPTQKDEIGIDILVIAKAMVTLGCFRMQQQSLYMPENYNPKQAQSLLEDAIAIYQNLAIENELEAKRGLAWAKVWLSCVYGNITGTVGEHTQAQTLAQEALDAFRKVGDSLGVAESLQQLGYLCKDPFEARKLHQKVLAIHEANDDPHGVGEKTFSMGSFDWADGEYLKARENFKASLARGQMINDIRLMAASWFMLGITSQHLGDTQQAYRYMQKSLEVRYEIGFDNLIVVSLFYKSLLLMAEGRFDESADVNDEVWHIAQKTGSQTMLRDALVLRARLARLQGDIDSAQEILESLVTENDIHPSQKHDIQLELGWLKLQVGNLPQAKKHFWEHYQFARGSPIFDGVALLAVKQRKYVEAVRLFGSRWCRGFANFLSPIEKEWRADDWAAMRTALGNEYFEQLYEEGYSMTREQAQTLVEELLDG